MSRLTIEVSKEEHRKIKTLAAMKGLTIKDFVKSCIFDKERSEDKDWLAFENLLLDRISDAKNNKVIEMSMMDIARRELSSKK